MRATNTLVRSRDMVLPQLFHFVRDLSVKRGRREDRVRAAPAVSCAIMHQRKCAHEHTGSAETLRPSLRNGFTTYTCSPWRPGFVCRHHPEKRQLLRDLTPTLGRQNHTLSPYSCLRLVPAH